MSFVDEVRLVGQFVWDLACQSFWRLILIFGSVFLASFLPAALFILALTVATQTYTRGVLFVVAFICLVPIAALMAFNYVAYRGLRDVAEKLGFGKKIGAGLVAYLEPSDRMRLPLSDLKSRIKRFLSITRREARSETRGMKGLCTRVAGWMFLYTARVVLNHIAKGCVVDNEVDLERFATGVGERADGMLISYFKKLLWDLTRLVLSVAVLLVWLIIIAVTQLINLFS